MAALSSCRATAAAPASATPGVVRVDAHPLRPNGDWQTLNYISSLTSFVARWIHAVALGEVLTYEISTHGSILLSQAFVLVYCIGLILAVVDARHAYKARSCPEQPVDRLRPLTTLA